MADHEDVDGQGFARCEATLLSYLLDARFEMRTVHVRWTAVDDDEMRVLSGSEMEEEAITFPRASDIEAENHCLRCSVHEW